MLKKENKKAQIWVETVIYTLIGLAIMGLLLTIIKPALDKQKDKILIEQSIELMEGINSEVEEVIYRGTGNTRVMSVKIKKGQLIINAEDNKIEFLMESKHIFSELGEEVERGDIKIKTEKNGNYEVSLSLEYELDLTWKGNNVNRVFQPAPTPYEISVTNTGISVDFS